MRKRYLTCLFFALCSTSVSATEWYEGGTLHSATAGKWHAASERNQLATSADFVTNVAKVSGLADIKTKANSLKVCITTATDDPVLYNQKVAEIAVICVLQLGFELK